MPANSRIVDLVEIRLPHVHDDIHNGVLSAVSPSISRHSDKICSADHFLNRALDAVEFSGNELIGHLGAIGWLVFRTQRFEHVLEVGVIQETKRYAAGADSLKKEEFLLKTL